MWGSHGGLERQSAASCSGPLNLPVDPAQPLLQRLVARRTGIRLLILVRLDRAGTELLALGQCGPRLIQFPKMTQRNRQYVVCRDIIGPASYGLAHALDGGFELGDPN